MCIHLGRNMHFFGSQQVFVFESPFVLCEILENVCLMSERYRNAAAAAPRRCCVALSWAAQAKARSIDT